MNVTRDTAILPPARDMSLSEFFEKCVDEERKYS